jgi:hypothetical protein
LRARFRCVVKLASIEDRARADDCIRNLAHLPDRFERPRSAKRYLKHPKPRIDERLRESCPILVAIEDEHRNDR